MSLFVFYQQMYWAISSTISNTYRTVPVRKTGDRNQKQQPTRLRNNQQYHLLVYRQISPASLPWTLANTEDILVRNVRHQKGQCFKKRIRPGPAPYNGTNNVRRVLAQQESTSYATTFYTSWTLVNNLCKACNIT